MKIFTAASPTEAHIVCGLLQQQSISAEVRGDAIFSLKGEVPFTQDTDPYVWLLQPNKLDIAKKIIKEYQYQEEKQTDWYCKACSEFNEGQFGVCWNCGENAN